MLVGADTSCRSVESGCSDAADYKRQRCPRLRRASLAAMASLTELMTRNDERAFGAALARTMHVVYASADEHLKHETDHLRREVRDALYGALVTNRARYVTMILGSDTRTPYVVPTATVNGYLASVRATLDQSTAAAAGAALAARTSQYGTLPTKPTIYTRPPSPKGTDPKRSPTQYDTVVVEASLFDAVAALRAVHGDDALRRRRRQHRSPSTSLF